MSAHLGPAVTALVDGELDDTRREEVLAHLAHCDPCRQEVEALRRFKAALRGAHTPEVPLDLSARLLALGLGGALGLAGPPPRPPVAPVDPTSPRFVIDHATTSGEVPFTAELDVVSVSSR